MSTFKLLTSSEIDTPLGSMIAVASDDALYLLEFADCPRLERLQSKTQTTIVPGRTQPIASIEEELRQYFSGALKEFKTPLCLLGSPFQMRVWEELQKIPFGITISYANLAARIGKPTASRAVAQANGANRLAIVIPCHRVIHANGGLGGYNCGIRRKKELLSLEKS
jgi:AraC family transcriptional regulator of adaptative response/methylated-DNA-[protein]-cysteine methyltransferase